MLAYHLHRRVAPSQHLPSPRAIALLFTWDGAFPSRRLAKGTHPTRSAIALRTLQDQAIALHTLQDQAIAP
ncbi:MAG: hypothetical protein ACYT04_41295 [Nostoc sp.]